LTSNLEQARHESSSMNMNLQTVELICSLIPTPAR
jgi:hypothetical protein